MRSAAGIVLLMLAAAQPAGVSAGAGGDCVAALAGNYAARHMEMGGGIALQPGGRFRYELAYGAIDEEASGRWTCDGDTATLTSDPVVAPRFELLGRDGARAGRLRVTLDLPEGLSRQYFSVFVRYADGAGERLDLTDDGLDVALPAHRQVRAIRPLLPIYELAGEEIAVPAGAGPAVHWRFRPNDLGKVAFAGTPLRRQGGALVLTRFGEAIRFVAVDGAGR
ncbi:MAG: hypothetical protein KGM18_00905 [Sphingomonadales bacterium]|nr:hypothetical protein [Sphingomonadales bacterium]